MNRGFAIWLLLLVLAGCAAAPSRAPATPIGEGVRAHPERYVVVTVRNSPSTVNPYAASTPRGYGGQGPYRASSDAIDLARQIAARHSLREVAAWPIELLNVHCLVYEIASDARRDRVIDELRRDPGVESAQPLSRFDLRGASYNDPYAALQRNLIEMGVSVAQQWSMGEGVRIAVVDTGVDTSHPDFANRLTAVADYVGVGRATAEGHGTAVAGIIAAQPNNGIGIVGIAPRAQVLPLRACWNADAGIGECNSFTLAQALVAALDAHVAIVNLSLGGPSDRLLERIVERGLERGTIFVGAVPASGRREGFPDAIDGVIAVDVADRLERAPMVLYAPGTDVFTLTPGGHYDAVSGSSAAAAEVTAVAALLLARRPTLRANEVQELLGRSMQVGDPPRRIAGSVNACAALRDLLRLGACQTGDSPLVGMH
ncbi:MAG TPA: S8 family serine peptidase [Burkholderiaceae bacterium]|nr:S8 family serine peptidase [Burkholderiaceae bacterium]